MPQSPPSPPYPPSLPSPPARPPLQAGRSGRPVWGASCVHPASFGATASPRQQPGRPPRRGYRPADEASRLPLRRRWSTETHSPARARRKGGRVDGRVIRGGGNTLTPRARGPRVGGLGGVQLGDDPQERNCSARGQGPSSTSTRNSQPKRARAPPQHARPRVFEGCHPRLWRRSACLHPPSSGGATSPSRACVRGRHWARRARPSHEHTPPGQPTQRCGLTSGWWFLRVSPPHRTQHPPRLVCLRSDNRLCTSTEAR